MRYLGKGTRVVIRWRGQNAGREDRGVIVAVWNESLFYDIALSSPRWGIEYGVPESIVFPDEEQEPPKLPEPLDRAGQRIMEKFHLDEEQHR